MSARRGLTLPNVVGDHSRASTLSLASQIEGKKNSRPKITFPQRLRHIYALPNRFSAILPCHLKGAFKIMAIIMKYLVLWMAVFAPAIVFGQTLQLHYDLRHTVDPTHNSQNFPTLYFEYFKAMDSTSSFIKPGAFFIKMENDLQGDRDNIGKAFIQTSQT